MKITPLEIRQKSFEKKMRGYDKDTVDAYILSLSHEWERNLDENKHLNEQLATAQHDVKKLREVEESLFKTLKTAEDTGSNLIDQANKSAELTIKEAQMGAEAMLAEARSQVRDMLDQADAHVKEVLGGLDDEARRVEGDLRMSENHRDAVLRELSMLANDTLARVANLSTERVDVVVPKKEIIKPAAPLAPVNTSITTAPIEPEKHEDIEDLEDEPSGENSSEVPPTVADTPNITETTNEVSFEINTSFEENKQSAPEPTPPPTTLTTKQAGSFFDHLD